MNRNDYQFRNVLNFGPFLKLRKFRLRRLSASGKDGDIAPQLFTNKLYEYRALLDQKPQVVCQARLASRAIIVITKLLEKKS